ncbi:MAG: hypothetical protein COW52_04465 [Nitrospirae bacterium CG17_big_fil_post_rev_8_21_14_2_50_50_9]|nr:MAG: hypothetical protein COW52_04465 [Nitrospirae bacterium CG17_big_fil_post_rev_8_21_14_2_50_50_9]
MPESECLEVCNADSVFKWLCSEFPKIFDKKAPLPLAIGIHHEIYEYAKERNISIDEAVISDFLRGWVKGQRYKKAIYNMETRYSLSGSPAQKITRPAKQIAIQQYKINQLRDEIRVLKKKMFLMDESRKKLFIDGVVPFAE